MAKKKDAMAEYKEKALSALLCVCEGEDARDADRVAAAKLLLEYAAEKKESPEGNVLRVLMEGMRGEYLR